MKTIILNNLEVLSFFCHIFGNVTFDFCLIIQAQGGMRMRARACACVYMYSGFKSLRHFFSHITTTAGCKKGLNAHFHRDASLRFPVPDNIHISERILYQDRFYALIGE